MPIIELVPGMTVSGAMTPDGIATLARSGVRLLVNNRPDGEAPGQLSSADEAALAEQAGLAYLHLPVRLPSIAPTDVDRFAQALDQAGGPVHAHCAAGMRSALLWMLAQVRSGRMDQAGLADWAAARGIDPSPALAWLDRNP